MADNTDRVVFESIETDHVASPAEYAALLPDDYSETAEPYPLLLLLHGANGNRDYVCRVQPHIESLQEEGSLPKFVTVTPSVRTGTSYLDDYAKKERWETFLIKQLIPHLQSKFNISSESKKTVVSGISMGGYGCLHLAFKYPHIFGAVASMEPGIWPGKHWDEVPDRHKFRPKDRMATLFGDPFDTDYWEANNPASIISADPKKFRDAQQGIYIECGDRDWYGFHEGTEFLHQVLWKHRIPHEYRLVRWADHTGFSLIQRTRDCLGFIGRYLTYPPPADPKLEKSRKNHAERTIERGFEPHPFWPKYDGNTLI